MVFGPQRPVIRWPWLVLLLYLTIGLIGPASINAQAETANYTIQEISYLHDPQGELSVADIITPYSLHAFTPIDGYVLNDGMSDSKYYWINLVVDAGNITDEVASIIALRTYWGEVLNVYELYSDGSYAAIKASNEQKAWSWLKPPGQNAYPVPIQANSHHQFLIQISPRGLIQTSIQIHSLEGFVNDILRINILRALFFSVVVTTVVYSFFINLSVANKLYYGSYTLSLLLLIIMSDYSHIKDIIKTVNFDPIILLNLMFLCAIIFSIKFYHSFLEIDQKTPFLYRLTTITPYITLGVFLLSLPFVTSPIIMTLLMITVMIGLMVISLIYMRRGFTPGIYLAIGSFIFIISITMSIITRTPLISSQLIDVQYYKIGVLLNVFMLSIALIRKLHLIQNEKTTLQQSLANSTKKNEQLKTVLFSNISHELLTPLNGIKGALQIIEHEPLPSTIEEPLNIIEKSYSTLYRKTKSLLSYIDYSNPDLVLEYIDTDIKASIYYSRNFLAKRLLDKNITFNIVGEEKIPKCVKSPNHAINIILGNLLSQASRFCSDCETTLEIDAEDIKDKTNFKKLTFMFSNIDNVTPERYQEPDQNLLDKIREKPIKSDENPNISMALTTLIATKIGGDIAFIDKPEGGKKCIFTIEVECCEPQEKNNSKNKDASKQTQIDTHKIINALLVDDNSVNVVVIKKLLESLNCRVSVAENGQGALDKTKNETFDIILMDCQMPIMDGFTATKKIRAQSNHYANTPIIAITANTMLADRKKCIEAGMNDFLEKPIDLATLKATIHHWSQ